MSKTTYEISLAVSFAVGNITEVIDVEDDLGYSEEDWVKMAKSEKDNVLNEYITEWAYNYVETGWKKL